MATRPCPCPPPWRRRPLPVQHRCLRWTLKFAPCGALTWPAVWLERRGLFCSPRRYRTLVEERLDAIRAHGESARYGAYFPAYLLKCLQDFFLRHGDDLYVELKHVRNALESLHGSPVFTEGACEQSRRIEALAAAHRILHASRHAPSHPDPAQPLLF